MNGTLFEKFFSGIAVSIFISAFFVGVTIGWLMPLIIYISFSVGIIFGFIGFLFRIEEKKIKTIIAEISNLFLGFVFLIFFNMYIGVLLG